MRTIILWDIDNTLLYTGGSGSLGMTRAFHELYGIDNGFGRVEFSGRSDSAIFRDAARSHAITGWDSPHELQRFLDAYVPHLEHALTEVSGGRLMPGVVATLEALSHRADVVQGLGTGNFRRGGELKLRHFGLDHYFPGCVGGFGEDSEHRGEVIAAGIRRLRNGGGADDRIVIIGDTPHDISAARANGAFAVGVATGRDTVDDLRGCGADGVLKDLSDVEGAIRIICGD